MTIPKWNFQFKPLLPSTSSRRKKKELVRGNGLKMEGAFGDPRNPPPATMVELLPRRIFTAIVESTVLTWEVISGKEGPVSSSLFFSF